MCSFLEATTEGYHRPRVATSCGWQLQHILPQVGRCLGTDLRFLHTISYRFPYIAEKQEIWLSLTARW